MGKSVTVRYYLPGGQVVSDHDNGSDELWQLLSELHQLGYNYSVTFRKFQGEAHHDEK